MLKELIGLLAAAGTGGLIYVISSSFNTTSYPQSFIEKSLAPSPVKYLSKDTKLTELDRYKFGELDNGKCKIGLTDKESENTGGTLDHGRNELLAAPFRNSSESKWTKLESFLNTDENVKSKCREKGSEAEENKKYLELFGDNANNTGQISKKDGNEHKLSHARLLK